MFTILIKTVLIFFIIIVVMRVMGKKQAGQLQPYELVVTLMIAEVASTPMDGPGTPISYGLVPAVTLMLLYFFCTFLSLKSAKMRELLCGKPSILIHDGRIRYHELCRSSYSLTDLMEQLRISGNTCIPEIRYAILETNGALSVLPYAENCPATPDDLGISPRGEAGCVSLVLDGRTDREGLHRAELTEAELHRMLGTLGFPKISEILLCTFSDNGKIFLQDRRGRTKYCTVREDGNA